MIYGQSADFSCSTRTVVASTIVDALQEWVITLGSGSPIVFDNAEPGMTFPPPDPPPGYQFIVDLDVLHVNGVRVVAWCRQQSEQCQLPVHWVLCMEIHGTRQFQQQDWK